MFKTTDALNGILEAPRENDSSVGMAPRHVEPAEVTLGNLALLGFVVGGVWNTRVDAASDELLKKKTKGRGKCSLDGDAFKDIPVQADGSVPHALGSVPTERVARKRILEATISVLLPLKVPVPDLAIESAVREIRPGDDGLVRDVGRSRVPQGELVSEHEFGPVWKSVMAGVHPFLPRSPVLVDVQRVNADLRLVERRGREVVRGAS